MNLPVPFKCPGGKRNLVKQLIDSFPKNFDPHKYLYIEPFCGGAALALRLVDQYLRGTSFKEPNIVINDYNPYIFNLLLAIKTNPTLLIKSFDSLEKVYEKSGKELFLKLRTCLQIPSSIHTYILSSTPGSGKVEPDYNQAAIFLFLNKNCFNGLIRFNRSGQFNSPYGSYKKVQTYNSNELHMLNTLLSFMQIEHMDFEALTVRILNSSPVSKSKLFFYFDPPYAPLSSTAKFTEYNQGGFSTYDQFRLKSLIDYLTHVNAKVMLSNSNADIVKKLYKDYNIKEIKALRVINSKITKRGAISEYIITNY